MKLVLASNNAKKLQELQALLGGLGVELVAQGTLGIPEAEEPYATFLENALTKARHASRASGLAALADDSGLCVDALGGAPGVHSARYAQQQGGGSGDAENNRALIECLRAHPAPAPHPARFVAALVAVRHADDPEPLVAFGRWEGEVVGTPRGTHGFGYDPLMRIPALGGRHVAELSALEKNAHSHRALAAAQMRQLMATVWQLGDGRG